MKVLAGIAFLWCGVLPAQEAGPNGIINTATGQAFLNGAPIRAPRSHIDPGDEIRTGEGMAEVLLTPGNFLRLGNGTQVAIRTLSSRQAVATLKHGTALLESLDESGPVAIEEARIQAVPGGPGLYEFDQSHGVVIVFSGRQDIRTGNSSVAVSQGFEADAHNLRIRRIKARAGDALYAWSSYRSEHLSSQSAAMQPSDLPRDEIGRPLWFRMPWADSYTFISAFGYVNSPFGWPFYAPGHTHNYIPLPGSGDSYLYGPPTVALPETVSPAPPGEIRRPAVPLTAPGVPPFPSSR
jgi:hypothetical protein